MNINFKTILIVFAKIVFIIGAFAFVFSKINIVLFLDHISKSDPFYLFLAFIMLQVSLFFSAMRSRLYFSKFKLKLKKTFIVMLYYVGTFFNALLPGGISGDGYKVYVLWKLEKFSKITGLRIMLYERVNGFHALVVLGCIFGCFSVVLKNIPYGFFFNLLALILVTPTYLWGVKYVLKDKVATAIEATFYSFIVQIFQVISAAFLVKAMMPDAGIHLYIDFIFLFIIGSIAAIIPISIGGAGLREITFLYGLSFLSYNISIEAGIAFASVTFALSFMTSIIGLPLWYKLNSVKRITKRRISIWSL